jgi:1-acyl-sn-glycerol-3-phosphate acyltransferase
MRKYLSYATFVPAFYWGCTHLLRLVLWVVGRWRVEGRENVPATGALLIVANHLSNPDPPILAAAILKRRIRFMAKVELYKYPFGVVPRLYGAFPIRRFDADLAAMLNAERILKKGEVLGMFPEGTRSRTGFIGEPHPGTALLALRSGATVLPCTIIGTEQIRSLAKLLRKPRITVIIGEPMKVEPVRRPSEEQVTALTKEIFDRVRSRLPAKYLPAYTESQD